MGPEKASKPLHHKIVDYILGITGQFLGKTLSHYIGPENPTLLEFQEIKVQSDLITTPQRLIFWSDQHIGEHYTDKSRHTLYLEKILKDGDILVLGGDVLTESFGENYQESSVESRAQFLQNIQWLIEQHPGINIWSIPGNHDVLHSKWEVFSNALKSLGVNDISASLISLQNGTQLICPPDYLSSKDFYNNPDNLDRMAEALDPVKHTIILGHDPKSHGFVTKALARAGVLLSEVTGVYGHIHGGQINPQTKIERVLQIAGTVALGYNPQHLRPAENLKDGSRIVNSPGTSRTDVSGYRSQPPTVSIIEFNPKL